MPEMLSPDLPRDPETGLLIQVYETSHYTDWEPDLPEGWAVYDDRSAGHNPEIHERHEEDRVRLIGPKSEVLRLSAENGGATFTPDLG